MRPYLIFCLVLLSSTTWCQEELTLLGRWTDSTLVSSNAHDNAYNEIWGLEVNDHEFAVIGTTYGTHFIDVTDPVNPVEVARIEGKAQGRSIIHRDYHDIGKYLFAVCDEGPSSLQIMDISGLPDTVIVQYDSDTLIQRSHNIFIDMTSALLYSLATRGTSIGSSPLAVFDISDPLDPKHIDNFRQFGDIRAGHVHDAYVVNDTAYLNCGYDGFAIVSFKSPENPQTISTLTNNEYPDAGYNHSGWRNNDGSYYYMADENHGFKMKSVKLDYNDLSSITTFDAQSNSPMSIAHNPLVACDFLYVAYYYDGLQIYDISNPAEPVRSWHYPTSILDNDRRYKGAWGVYPFLGSGNILVSDMQRGLFVIEGIDPNCNRQDVTTSQSSTDTETWRISPNPCIDHLSINDLPRNALYTIFNAQGSLMTHGQGSGRIDIDTWPSGVYIFQVGKSTKRFIKL